MNPQIDIQHACLEPILFTEDKICSWVNLALDDQKTQAELTLRFVDIAEISDLNKTYRKKDKPTNVLAFPSDVPDFIEMDYPFLGDLVICPAVLSAEAKEQAVSLEAHWAHIVIHGVLHLLGFDHIKEEDESIMQALEIKLLAKLGFSNPYAEEGDYIEQR